MSVHAPESLKDDAAGNMTRRHGDVIGDSTNVQSQFYDGLNRPTYWENTRGGDAWFSRMHYQFDKVGREVATWRDEDGNKGERFTFNASNHLTKAVYKADNVSTQSPVNAAVEQVYTYPADMLNRASMTENGVVTNYAPNGLNQYTNVGGTSVQYDGNFNLSAFGTATATYNAKSQLTSVSNGSSAQFVYDGLGRCMKRTVNGVPILFAYDGWKPVVEYDGAGNLQARNIYGAGPDEILVRGSGYGWFFYHTDKQGSVTALVDLNGNVVKKYTYDAFGKPTITDWWGTPHYDAQGRNASWYGNRFLYTGREWIAELNLYDYRNRFYFPLIGRFLQTDPLGLQTEGEKLSAGQKAMFSPGGVAPEAFGGSEMNLFRYCHNDPVDESDPLGLEPIPISARLDELGIQASDNSLAASRDGYPRSQLIQETNGKLELQNKFNEPVAVRVPNYGSVVPAVMMEETARPDRGSKTVGVGHAHKDLHGRPKPGDSDFSKKDYLKATGDKKKGIIGTPVWKVNESDPRRIDRLTPDTTPGEKPTKIRVR